MKSGLYILLCFALGLAVAQCHRIPQAWGDTALTLALYVLLLLAGMCIGFDVRNFSIVRNLGMRVIFLPLGIMFGSALGGLVAWAGLNSMQDATLSLRDTMAVASGFGYYSLSSVIIARFGDAALGSVALIANVTRELLTLLAAPLLVRFGGALAPVATSAAAAMDTCLPVIARHSGEQYAILGIFSGMILSLAVPFLVTGLFVFF
ncbi:MAG: lysine exporter LysO family protein [Desulfovibrionaceae bacterium]